MDMTRDQQAYVKTCWLEESNRASVQMQAEGEAECYGL